MTFMPDVRLQAKQGIKRYKEARGLEEGNYCRLSSKK